MFSEVEVNVDSFVYWVDFLSPCFKLSPSAQFGLATKASTEQERGGAGGESVEAEGREACRL